MAYRHEKDQLAAELHDVQDALQQEQTGRGEVLDRLTAALKELADSRNELEITKAVSNPLHTLLPTPVFG